MTIDYKMSPGELEPGDVRAADLGIGLDVGGSGIKGSVVEVTTGRRVGLRLRAPTPQPSAPREVVAAMDQLVRDLSSPWTGGEAASFPVGVGIPCVVRRGVALTAANVEKAWIGFPVASEMSERTGRPVTVANDADVAGLAEVRFGAGRGHSGVIMVLTIGTGMGTALFVDGRLVPNLELGHLELNGRDAEERVAESGKARFELSWEDWAKGFDAYLHMLERLFWPDLFIFGGGGSKRADNYLPLLTVRTPIAIATMRNDAGIVGAALMAAERRSREAISVG